MKDVIFVLTWIVVIWIWVDNKRLFNTENPREWMDWVTTSIAYSIIPMIIGGWLMS